MGRKPSEDRGDLNLKNEYDNEKLGLLMMLLLLSRIALFCQAQTAGIEEKEVLRNEDVISIRLMSIHGLEQVI